MPEPPPTVDLAARCGPIAQAAVHRGVPWALHSDGAPHKLVVDPEVHPVATDQCAR